MPTAGITMQAMPSIMVSNPKMENLLARLAHAPKPA